MQFSLWKSHRNSLLQNFRSVSSNIQHSSALIIEKFAWIIKIIQWIDLFSFRVFLSYSLQLSQTVSLQYLCMYVCLHYFRRLTLHRYKITPVSKFIVLDLAYEKSNFWPEAWLLYGNDTEFHMKAGFNETKSVDESLQPRIATVQILSFTLKR